MPITPVTTALHGAAAGTLASWVKSLSEPPLQRLAERLAPPTVAEKSKIGADAGNPRAMPPAVVVDRAARALAGRSATGREKMRGLPVIHYTVGIGIGVVYASAVRRWPGLATGAGAPAGLALYLTTHVTALPMLRVQRPPTGLPASAVVWEASSHVLYGVVLESTRHLLVRVAAG